MFNFIRHYRTFSRWLYHLTLQPARYQSSSAPYPCEHWLYCWLFKFQPLIGWIDSDYGFDLYFTNDIEHLFMWLFVIWVSSEFPVLYSKSEVSVQIFCWLKKLGSSCYWLVRLLYVFWIQGLYPMCFANIFSPDSLVFSFSQQYLLKSRSSDFWWTLIHQFFSSSYFLVSYFIF